MSTYIHIPRTGGSSIREQLPPHVDVWGHNLRRADYQFCLDFDEYIFTFLRDPCSRFISAYNYLNKGGKIQKDSQDAYIAGVKALNIREFAEKKLEDAAFWQIHFLPQHRWLQHVRPSFTGRFENLEEDFHRVCMELGVEPRALPHINTSAKMGYDLSQEIKPIIREVYAKDYELIESLGYETI